MYQFKLPKRWRRSAQQTNDTTCDLLDLAGNIELEEKETEAEQGDPHDVAEDHDSDDGWVDEQGDMIQKEIDKLEESVWPIQFLLMKVSEWVSKSCIVLAN